MITKISNSKLYAKLFEDASKVLTEIKGTNVTITDLNTYFQYIGDLRAKHIEKVTEASAMSLASAQYRNEAYNSYSRFLMLPLEEPYFSINANSRSINVPAEFKTVGGVGLTGDQIAETILFEIDRYFDFMDLINTNIFVQWKKADGSESASRITLVDFTDNKIRFGWPITNVLTDTNGKVEFSVRFISYSNEDNVVYSFNTLPANIEIKKSLIPDFDKDIKFDDASELLALAINNGADSEITIQPVIPVIYEQPNKVIYLKESDEDENKDSALLKISASNTDTGILSYVWKRADLGESIYSPIESTIGYEKTKDTSINANKKYYVEEDGSYSLYDEEDSSITIADLYEQYAYCSIPANDANGVITEAIGKYQVEIKNSFYKEGSSPAASVSTHSEIISVPAPSAPKFKTELNSNEVFGSEGNKTLTVDAEPTDSADDGHNEFTYQWYGRILSDEGVLPAEMSAIDGEVNKGYTATKPGIYKVSVTNAMNGQSVSAESGECKITNMPVAPVITSTGVNGISNINANLNEEVNIVVEVSANQYNELESDEIEYVWYFGTDDANTKEEDERIIITDDNKADCDVIKVDKNNLIVKMTNNGSNIYRCTVTNKLSGYTASADSDAYVVTVV